MKKLENNFNFDPYAGIKLYSYLYDLGYQDIDVDVTPHNLIFGELKEVDNFNFTKKVEIAAKNSGYRFEGYDNSDLRRFTYTPLISCRGLKSTP
jgi:hypothetical protein